MLTITCSNGKFTSPSIGFDYESIAEVLMRKADIGAVASWSPTGLRYSTGHKFLDQGFFEAVFQDDDGIVPIGQATFNGKLNLWSTGSNLDLLDTFLLFGDPALRLLTVEHILPKPSNLTAAAISTSQIDLSWTDNANDETSYRVERSPDGTNNWVEIANLGADETVYSDAGLAPGTEYFYRIRVYRTGDQQYSFYSNVDSAITSTGKNIYFPLIILGD